MAEQVPDKPKRKRRTKAEMEAARAAGMEKPPTQGVGVIGINDSAFGADTSGVRWEALIHIPKFQAFCIEKSKLSYENVMDWIIDFCVAELNKDASRFFEEYKKWHDAKGYWKNETIYGELIVNAIS
ncbi:hypothetical protein [Acinetobacter sp. 197]|uniref:hypothetical protein n=1 Tax=Acinetobacter sp. 197 TaxID=3114696 RepID=UPI003A8B4689